MCNITYTSLELNSDATQLTLTGTTDCSKIRATVKPYTDFKSTTVSGGNWSITYTAADMLPGHSLSELKERCGHDIKIDAVCEDDDNCRDSGAHVLTCRTNDGGGDCCSLICCMVFKLLILLGFGLAGLGSILVVCSIGLCDAVAMDQIGAAFRIWGILLMVIGLAFWLSLCRPKKCEWLALLWQALLLFGLLAIYAGLCPECIRMLYYGVVIFVLGLLLYFWWLKNCDVSLCKKLSEWAGLFLIPVNMLLGLAAILLTCSRANRIAPMIIIALVILFEAWLLFMLKKNNCLKC